MSRRRPADDDGMAALRAAARAELAAVYSRRSTEWVRPAAERELGISRITPPPGRELRLVHDAARKPA